MKQTIINKGVAIDSVVVAGASGSLTAMITDTLPIIIGIMTIVLLAFRIAVTYQEFRKNKKNV